ncbi:RING/U-box superfamily protein, partial [Trifolium medium]|nr:RING/U-box superfamily protein [Trifolium medium]
AESLSVWLADPTYPNTTLSWNMIHGTGMITQEIFRSSSYYVALGNLEGEDVEVFSYFDTILVPVAVIVH